MHPANWVAVYWDCLGLFRLGDCLDERAGARLPEDDGLGDGLRLRLPSTLALGCEPDAGLVRGLLVGRRRPEEAADRADDGTWRKLPCARRRGPGDRAAAAGAGPGAGPGVGAGAGVGLGKGRDIGAGAGCGRPLSRSIPAETARPNAAGVPIIQLIIPDAPGRVPPLRVRRRPDRAVLHWGALRRDVPRRGRPDLFSGRSRSLRLRRVTINYTFSAHNYPHLTNLSDACATRSAASATVFASFAL